MSADTALSTLGIIILATLAGCTSNGGTDGEASGESSGTSGTSGSSEGSATTTGSADETGTAAGETTTTTETGGEAQACADIVVTDYYPNAETGTCTSEAGMAIAATMMDLEGITIDNLGQTMTPCLRVECDDDDAYIVSNNIPHYDFVQLTPNELVEAPGVYRIPLVPTDPVGRAPVDVDALMGCNDQYTSYIAGAGASDEPGGICGDGYIQTPEGTFAQLACLSEFAVLNSGVVANGPNEGDVGLWGDPGLEPVNDMAPPPGAAVDYCGGHTGMSMHYHSLFESCFEVDEDNHPTIAYSSVALEWDALGQLTDDCTEPSEIVGWSFDGYPIKGPCLCTRRADDGSCEEVKRARSSWMYRGLSSHRPKGSEVDPSLAVEGVACEATADCCEGVAEGEFCDFQCNNVVTDDASGGSTIEKICTNVRYAWCTREYADLASADVSAENFVHLDRCNGYESADGFAYHAVSTFPYIQACYRGEPAEQANAGGGGGGGGGGEVTTCETPDTVGCCGDDVCDGPETQDNCPVDCP